jgi:hypothetical protein
MCRRQLLRCNTAAGLTVACAAAAAADGLARAALAATVWRQVAAIMAVDARYLAASAGSA